MTFPDRRSLKEAGAHALSRSYYDPQKLILIHIGVVSALMLLVSALDFVLRQQIGGTGGLSGMGLRAVLETGIQVLQLATNLLLPFWSFGYLACMLRIVRGQEFGPGNMLDGFRNFGQVLRLNLLRGCYFILLGFMCLYVSMFIFELSPLAQPMMDLMEPQMEAIQAGAVADLSEVDGQALFLAMLPLAGIFLVLFLIAAGPHFYRFRMADYALIDYPGAGARMAIHRSTVMMKGNRIALLKLDLSFWWYYLLDLLTVGLMYLDVLLMLAGIVLPIPVEFGWLVFYVLYLVGQVALNVWARNKVEAAYAMAYEVLNQELEEELCQVREELAKQAEHQE